MSWTISPRSLLSCFVAVDFEVDRVVGGVLRVKNGVVGFGWVWDEVVVEIVDEAVEF